MAILMTSTATTPVLGSLPARKRNRWLKGLLIAAVLVTLMACLAALEVATCTGSKNEGIPCLEVPRWVFYTLDALAMLCLGWSVLDAAMELASRSQGTTAASGSTGARQPPPSD